MRKKKTIYEKYNLKQWDEESLELIKKYSPKQYEAYQRREYLISKGLYNTYKREVSLNNLYNVLFEKSKQYNGTILYNHNELDIDEIIFKLRLVRPSYLDNLIRQLSPFLETYSETKQKAYDYEQLKNLLDSLNNFLDNPKIKRAKTFRYKTIKDDEQIARINHIYMQYIE